MLAHHYNIALQLFSTSTLDVILWSIMDRCCCVSAMAAADEILWCFTMYQYGSLFER